MRGVAANQRIKKRVNFVHNDRQMETAHVPADQERAVIAKDILDRATGREGAILLRRGMGFSLEEIGIDIGLCRERVRQLEDKGRSRLRKACGLKVAA